MTGEVSERRRREVPRELDDIPRREREAIEDSERQEGVSETREVTTPSEYVDQHMDKVLHEIETRESKDERVSQGMDNALHKIEELNSRPESTEKRLEEALESIEERPVPAEKASTSEVPADHYQVKLDDFEMHEAPEAQGQRSQELRYDIDSKEALDKAIQQNHHVKRGFSQETYETCEQYIRVISEESTISASEIAEKENLSQQTVENWREGVKPRPIHVIENMEAQRLEHEHSVPNEALKHRIDPAQVREITESLRESEQHTVKELVDVVVDIHNIIEGVQQGSVHYAELYDSQKPLTEDRLRNLAVEIRANREIIQTELNSRLGLDAKSDYEVRIGVTDSRLYYWQISISPDMWVNVLADQKFYMSKEDKLQLIDEMQTHLHIRGGGQTSEYYLNDLINQLSGLENPAANRIGRYYNVYSLDGEVMHLIGDLQRKTLEEFKPLIDHMGTKKAARISNIRFPNIHEYRMKFVGIAESDCHLDDEGRFSYYEKNQVRQKMAVDVFLEFGDFVVKIRKGNSMQVDLPRLLGAMADYWEIPRGDKAIHNRGLPESIINETPEYKILYPRQMVPEDGNIDNHSVNVNRYLVLHAGKRMNKYQREFGIEPHVTSDHIELVRDRGTPQPAHLCYNEGDVIRLYLSELEKISKIKDLSHVSKDLYRIIYETPHRLLKDEVEHIIRPLGIEMNIEPSFVQYYSSSQRLSVCYTASTKTKNDAIRWVLIAPPEHPDKMEIATEMIRNDLIRSQKIAKEIEKDGLTVNPIWEGYLG